MNRSNIALVAVLGGLLVVFCGGEPRVTADNLPKKTSHAPVDHSSFDVKNLNLRGCKLRDLKEYDSAMYFFRSALELARQHQLGIRMAAAFQNMGTVYSDRAYDFREYNHEADLESTAACYDSAYRILLDSGKYNQAVSVLTDRAVAYFRDPKYEKRADSLFQRARSQAQEHGLVFNEGLILYHQAQLHANQAVDTRDLPGLRSAVLLLDTAAILLRRADRGQTAGSAEELAEEMRQAIQKIESYEKSRKGNAK
jgi:tetratricopeptide (TPR) repeat protein